MPTYTSNYNLILPLPLNPVDANIWGPMINTNTSFADTYNLSLANNFIGATAPIIPATTVPATGQFWINNTTSGSWPVQVYDGSNWVAMGVLNNVAHTFNAIGVGNTLNTVIISSTGTNTYVPTTGIKSAFIQILGAGGAGGGSVYIGGGNSCGGGGGAGQYNTTTLTSASLGSPITVTIGTGGVGASGTIGGNGGTTSFGSILTAGGGNGGAGGINSTTPNITANGGAGGAGGAGGITGGGASGTNGMVLTTTFAQGVGGATLYGGRSNLNTLPGPGGQGQGFGSGGSGAYSSVSGGVNYAGGNGANGLCIIIELI